MTHRRTAVIQRNKPFKGKSKASSAAKAAKTGSGHSPKVHVLVGKDARKSSRKMLREQKTQRLASQLETKRDCPRMVVFLPVHPGACWVDFVGKVVSRMRDEAPDVKAGWNPTQPTVVPMPGWAGKGCRSLEIVCAPHVANEYAISMAELTEHAIRALDLCKVADIVVPVFGDVNVEDAGFGRYGNEVMSLLNKQGLPSVVALAPQITPLVSRSVATSFGSDTKVFDVDRIDQFIRHLNSGSLKPLKWRDDYRGYGLVNTANCAVNGPNVVLKFYARGLGFSVRHPVHITGVGDFPIEELGVDFAHNEHYTPLEKLDNTAAFESGWNALAPPGSSNVIGVNDTLVMTDEAVDIADMSTASEGEDDVEEEFEEQLDSDGEDAEPFVDYDDNASVSGALQLRDWVDMEFPDEVDTPNDVLAKDHFEGYKGLKDFKNSSWVAGCSEEPEYYQRVWRILNYRRVLHTVGEAYKTNLGRTRELANAVKGRERRVVMRLRIPDEETRAALLTTLSHNTPLVISTMTMLERKVSVQHFSMTRFGDSESVCVPTQARMLLQSGFRREFINPLVSEPVNRVVPVEAKNPSNHKQHTHRYWRNSSKQPVTLSFVGPTPSFQQPALVWFVDCSEQFKAEIEQIVKQAEEEEEIRTAPQAGLAIAHGAFITTDVDRLLIRRILLTGYPRKISGKKAIVSRMFMNRTDVEHFRNVGLFTRRGASGKILEPVGLHGDMKCIFSQGVDHRETICLPLYKRVFPQASVLPRTA